LADPLFPDDLSENEEALGFSRKPIGATSNGATVFALVCEIASGLRAVKTRRADGNIEYAIWDQVNNVPIYFPAASLDELQRRFPK
jgi:hypothetical protein